MTVGWIDVDARRRTPLAASRKIAPVARYYGIRVGHIKTGDRVPAHHRWGL